MLIKVIDESYRKIIINTDHIVNVHPYKNGILIRFADESKEVIPDVTIEAFMEKTMDASDALIESIKNLEDSMRAALHYVGNRKNLSSEDEDFD